MHKQIDPRSTITPTLTRPFGKGWGGSKSSPVHPVPKLTRRAGLAALLALISSALQDHAGATNTNPLVFAGPGGEWGAAIRASWLDPFTDATGMRVVSVQTQGATQLRAMIAAGRVTWDVLEVTPDFPWIGARDGLLEPLDFKIVDASLLIHGPDLVTPYSVADVLWSQVMFCNTQQFPEGRQPLNWTGVWNTNGFGGKRSFPAKADSGIIEAALLADGVTAANLYPLDIDRALKSLDHIRDHIVWSTSDAQSEQIMLDGDAVLGLVTDRSALAAIERGAQIAIQYNQSLLTWSSLVIPKGAPNRAAAMALLNFVLTPEAQAAIAMADTFGPVTASAFEQIPPHRASMLSGGPQQEGRSLWKNERWWAENRPSATRKFDSWRLG